MLPDSNHPKGDAHGLGKFLVRPKGGDDVAEGLHEKIIAYRKMNVQPKLALRNSCDIAICNATPTMSGMNDETPKEKKALNAEFAERLKLARESAGYSTALQFAQTAGISIGTYGGHEAGTRAVNRSKAIEYAQALNVRPAWLLTGDGEMRPEAPAAPVSFGLIVRGAVQAGHFAEAYEWGEDDWYRTALPVTDLRYPGAELFGLEVRGESMNRRFPPGTTLACINLIHYQVDVKEGQYVIVETHDGHGGVEATVKKVRRDSDGKIWLWPESDSPHHQSPIDPDNGKDVRVVALVVQYSAPI